MQEKNDNLEELNKEIEEELQELQSQEQTGKERKPRNKMVLIALTLFLLLTIYRLGGQFF